MVRVKVGLHIVCVDKMESVYERGPRPWVSEKICLRDYFSKFEAAVPCTTEVPKLMNVSLTREELKILSDTCRFVDNVIKTVPFF